MPKVPFAALPDEARIWIFGASAPLDDEASRALLTVVDDYLEGWQAHGEPLVCARDWRDDRFLVIGVDQRSAGASGCSIDALFRALQPLERALGTTLLASGRIFYRDATGEVQCVDRATFSTLAREGGVTGETAVFDTTLTSAGAYRAQFERPSSASWHAQLA